MIGFEQLRYVVNNPTQIARFYNRMFHSRLQRRDFYPYGVDIAEEDWDICLLLDGCRADLFESTAELDGDYQRKQSRGSMTREFLIGNFRDRDLLDTVYVTANPMLARYRDELRVTFHDEIHVWQEAGWNSEFNTVLPETVATAARKTDEKHPDKRLVIHFMQPHYPFLSEINLPYQNIPDEDEEGKDFWTECRRGEASVSAEDIWTAYEDTLRRCSPILQELITDLPGRTVVTSDHGNMIGERSWPIPIREWGHPPSLYTSELLNVPWLVVEDAERREISAEDPTHNPVEKTTNDAKRRLRQLGYLDS